LVNQAIAFATRAHEGQVRKGTTRPFILHPLEVGEIVATMTDDEEIISAAILHDTIEDCENITEETICEYFGTGLRNWLHRKVKTRLNHGWNARVQL